MVKTFVVGSVVAVILWGAWLVAGCIPGRSVEVCAKVEGARLDAGADASDGGAP